MEKNPLLNIKCGSIIRTVKVSGERERAGDVRQRRERTLKEERGALAGSFVQCEIVLVLNSVSRER